MSSAAALLAIDCSTDRLCLAACAGVQQAFYEGPGSAAASDTLLPQAESLLRQLGLAWAELDSVAFARGPGAFTGLRAACAVAQGLGYGLQRPLLPIDSLAIVAEAACPAARAPDDGDEIGVAVDARMGEVYAARYRCVDGGWLADDAPALWSPAILAAAWTSRPPPRWAGNGLGLLLEQPEAWPAETCAALRAAATLAKGGAPQAQRPPALLRLAQRAWARQAFVAAADALPLYIRDKVALTSAERLSARPDAAPP